MRLPLRLRPNWVPPRPGPEVGVAHRPPVASDALLVVPMFAIFALWVAKDGGYDPTIWLPGTLFALGTVVVLVIAAPREFARRRGPAAATLLFLAFTVWCFASMSWAGDRGIAWDGANRTLLYLLVFSLFAWRPISSRLGFGLLGAYAVAVALAGSVALVRASNVNATFVAGRFAAPISYPNANAAAFLMAGLPALVVGSRRGVHPVLRAAALAAAGVLAELALLCQSRASVVALPLALLATLALVPRRLSFLVASALVAAPVAISANRILAVYPSVVSEDGVTARLHDARVAVAGTAAALFVAGLALAVADSRLAVPRRVARVAGIAVVVLAVAGLVAGAGVFVRRYGNPVHAASVAWRHFKRIPTTTNTSTSSHLLSGIGSQRYDLWRVAVHEFVDSPIRGVGVDNYAADYLRLRRISEEPLYPHSLELRLLAQTGLVGTLLFAGFLGAALAAGAAGYRRTGPDTRALAAACLGGFVYWLVHGSVDWLWEFPALGAPAIAFLAIAARAGPARLPAATPLTTILRLRYLLLVPAAAAGAAIALPWTAAHDVGAATAAWRTDPGQAFRRLDRAATLNPLDDEADLVAGVIAVRLRDRPRAVRSFKRALARNPSGWFARLELAAIESQAGRRRAALRQLSKARALDPHETVITSAIQKVRHGDRISVEAIEALLVARTRVLVGAQQR